MIAAAAASLRRKRLPFEEALQLREAAALRVQSRRRLSGYLRPLRPPFDTLRHRSARRDRRQCGTNARRPPRSPGDAGSSIQVTMPLGRASQSADGQGFGLSVHAHPGVEGQEERQEGGAGPVGAQVSAHGRGVPYVAVGHAARRRLEDFRREGRVHEVLEDRRRAQANETRPGCARCRGAGGGRRPRRRSRCPGTRL